MSKLYSVFKWLILIAAFIYLAYKLITFKQYHELAVKWHQMPLSQFWWLAGVVALLPLNWFLEAIKWKKLTSNIQRISLTTSCKAVLAGISTGFFTPNRAGELVGRVIFLEDRNRKAGITLSIVNSLTQNLIMTLCGIPATLLFFSITSGSMESENSSFLFWVIGFLLLFGLFYFALPRISQLLAVSNISARIATFTACLSLYTIKQLVQILTISLFRYAIFGTQFYLMLRFFGVNLEIWQALIAIPASYLFVTFTPSLAFSEAAVRSSYAVLFIGAFSGQVVGIALAGVCIWSVNFIIPMMVGSVLMVRKRL